MFKPRTPHPFQKPLMPPFRKKKIPKALREAVWLKRKGEVFRAKCDVPWCPNTITVFDYQCGHDIPESRGGATKLENLYPICSRCNLSMSNQYTLKEWSQLQGAAPEPKPGPLIRLFSCFWPRRPPAPIRVQPDPVVLVSNPATPEGEPLGRARTQRPLAPQPHPPLLLPKPHRP